MNLDRKNKEIEPDEIFLDSSNLSFLNLQQFEGWIEKPIKRSVFLYIIFFFLVICFVFGLKLWSLQIDQGGHYAKRSEQNSLKKVPFLYDRGVIYDRNDKILAWNEIEGRKYTDINGLHNTLGYLGFPSSEELKKNTLMDPKELVGKEGVEKIFDDPMRGKEGFKIIEVDVNGNIHSENLYSPGERGVSIKLSLDAELSGKIFEYIRELAIEKGFVGGAGVVMDIHSGEIIAITSYPEYDSTVMTRRKDNILINRYFNDAGMPFLNRVVSGLYLPGSIIKPFVAIGALKEGVVSPEKEIFSSGSISVPNPYFPEKPTVFRDWKAHGWTDMRKAISVSSDVYFYSIGGGHEEQRGMGILNIEKYSRLFGFGTSTGIELQPEATGNIPSPKWKEENFKGDKWTLGNTYHSSIGQYGFLVTPIQAVRAVSSIANDGELIEPTILMGIGENKNQTRSIFLDIEKSFFSVVKEGMRDAVTEGTAQGLNFPGLKVAAKTGTAEIDTAKRFVNSWVVGFFPYEEPKYAFALIMEKGPYSNSVGGVYVMRKVFEWMINSDSEYISN